MIPILDRESKRFMSDNERSFLHYKKEFFSFLDDSAPSEFREFAKKHLKVVDNKSPSMKQLIERCSEVLVQEGYPVPVNAARVINEARHPLFHGSTSLEIDLAEAAYCTKVVMVLLILRAIGVPARAIKEI
jgi:hypothetical protein